MEQMLFNLREFNTASVLLRLGLAMIFGGAIGLERGRKHRAAGFRTHMLVCIGAALTMMLGQYEHSLVKTVWINTAASADVSRLSAQVINGIGFLGAGTVVVTGRQNVKGLTTAAGLWASACTGLAIGAGYYECVLMAFLVMLLVVRVLPAVELSIVERSRYMNIYVEFESPEHIRGIINHIKAENVRIFEVEMDHSRQDGKSRPSAVFSVLLKQRKTHGKLLASLSEVEGIHVIEELR